MTKPTTQPDEDAPFWQRRNLPELAYAFIEGNEPGDRLGIIKRGEAGYHRVDYDRPDISADRVHEMVALLNLRLEVTPAQSAAMVIGSMFGWSVPGADATRYDEDGTLKKAEVWEAERAAWRDRLNSEDRS